ncbi:hypothetical protein AERO8C_50100 [Aeromonas veronii]|uniref:Uncharacterized protein n=1 Tax=Aeromonas veronii TaxID=654 RepID=A0A653L776_AERVE|nr:hypothetical protein AERO8C_50100 [Aeromonas veronii]
MQPGGFCLADCLVDAGSARRFVELQRQAVGVGEEGKALAGQLVHPYRLYLDPMGQQVGDDPVKIADPKGEMAQAARLGAGGALGRRGEAEQLQLAAVRQGQIQFPRLARFAQGLGDDGQLQYLVVEVARAWVIAGDDGHMVDGVKQRKGHGVSLSAA